MIGKGVKASMAIVVAVIAYSHERMVLKTPSFIESEIERTGRLIRQAGYQSAIHFRPPYGKKLILLPTVSEMMAITD